MKGGKVKYDNLILKYLDEIKTMLARHMKNQGGMILKPHYDAIPLAVGGDRGAYAPLCDSESSSDEEGTGITAIPLAVGGHRGAGAPLSITNLGKKAYKGAKSVVNKTTEVAKKVITGNTGMPPNVKKILDKDGDKIISKIVIARTPLGSALMSALNVASLGDFKKKLKDTPYDKLFHLKLIITLQNGTKLALEKEERVNLSNKTQPKKGQEEIDVPVDKTITLNQLYHNAEIRMGDRFYPYSAKDNNCQNFVLNVLQASNLGGSNDYEFVKQNTQSLFADDNYLRKLSNTLTDIGARFNVLMQGGKIRKGKGLVFPPDYVPPNFLTYPTYIQNDVLAGDVSTKPTEPDMTGTGVDFEDVDWGSFRKYFHNRPARLKHLKSLEALADYIMHNPHEFNAKTKKRANFYLHVILKK